jgi:elongation factor Ts
MSTITAAMVKELRQKTGAAMMACKKALQEVGGNIDEAIKYLRKAGEAKADKRSGKTAAEGRVAIAQSTNKKSAFIAEVNSETDFVARDESFVAFANTIAQRGLDEKVTTLEALLELPYEAGSDVTVDTFRKGLINKLGENVQIRRVTLANSDGVVGDYCHGDRIGVLVAVNQDNMDLAKDIAMHIAATNPQAITENGIPQSMLDNEKDIFMAQAKESGKPQEIIEKMVTGRINKFLKEVSLVGQPFVKDSSKSIGVLLKEHGATVTSFVRLEVGEGIEKEEQSFADEVMAQVQGND